MVKENSLQSIKKIPEDLMSAVLFFLMTGQ